MLPECGGQLATILRQSGVPVTQRTEYAMDHECCEEQLDDLKAFLRRQVPPAGQSELELAT